MKKEYCEICYKCLDRESHQSWCPKKPKDKTVEDLKKMFGLEDKEAPKQEKRQF